MAEITAEQRTEGRSINRKRLALEKKLTRELKAWNKKITLSFKAALERGNTGRFIISADDRASLRAILAEHYDRVVDAFTPFDARPRLGSKQAGDSGADEVADAEDEIIALLVALISIKLPANLNAITQTTEDDAATAYAEARELAIEEAEEAGVPVSEAAIMAGAIRILANRLAARTMTRAITETTWIAEATRSTEVRVIMDRLAEVLRREAEAITAQNKEAAEREAELAARLAAITPSHSAIKGASIAKSGARTMTSADTIAILAIAKKIALPIKVWITMQDKRVRKTHRRAQGQRVPENEPFTVGKSLLMFPGDDSLGAQLSELVNCRCFLFYE